MDEYEKIDPPHDDESETQSEWDEAELKDYN